MSKQNRRPRDRKVRSSASGSPESVKSSSPAAAWALTAGLVLFTVILTAILFRISSAPGGVIHELQRIELNRLLDYWRAQNNEVDRGYLEASCNHQKNREFIARIRSNEAVDQIIRDGVSAIDEKEYLQNLITETDYDSSNLLTRLSIALALGERRKASVEESSLDQFNYILRIVTRPPEPTIVDTYSNEFRLVARSVIDRYVTREANIEGVTDEFYYTRYRTNTPLYSAIPWMVKRLETLANKLNTAGHVDQAVACYQWIGQLCFGLILNDSDTSLQLVAARSLVNAFDGKPEITDPLNKFIERHGNSRPLMGTEGLLVGPSNTESLAPQQYAASVESFARFAAAGALLIGALAAVFLSFIASFMTAKKYSPPADKRYPFVARVGLYLIVIILIPVVFIWRRSDIYTDAAPYFSEEWGLAILLAFGVVGAALSIIRAIIENAAGSTITQRLKWGSPALLLFVLAALFIATSPRTSVWWLRSINFEENWLYFAILAAAIVFVAAIVSRVPSMRFTRVTAMTALLFGVLTMGLFFVHRRTDAAYQVAVVEAHKDPMAARVGNDWREKYIEPARSAFEKAYP